MPITVAVLQAKTRIDAVEAEIITTLLCVDTSRQNAPNLYNDKRYGSYFSYRYQWKMNVTLKVLSDRNIYASIQGVHAVDV